MAALRVVHLMMPDDDVLSQVVPVIEMGMMSYDDLAKIYYRIHTNASRVSIPYFHIYKVNGNIVFVLKPKIGLEL